MESGLPQLWITGSFLQLIYRNRFTTVDNLSDFS